MAALAFRAKRKVKMGYPRSCKQLGIADFIIKETELQKTKNGFKNRCSDRAVSLAESDLSETKTCEVSKFASRGKRR